MTRAAFGHDLEVRQQYLSMVYHAFPGTAWVLLNEGRVITPNQSGDETEYSRIGDKNKLKVANTVTTDVAVQVYFEDNLTEVARILGGNVRPGGGWVGTEEIQLDTTVIHNFKVENYDGITAGAALLFTEYVNSWRPSGVGTPLDAEGDVRIAEFSGAASSYYIIPAAGV